ncbi:hypothetical protein LINGRAHAP2_LOCUS18845 [Linum grandiflorum]
MFNRNPDCGSARLRRRFPRPTSGEDYSVPLGGSIWKTKWPHLGSTVPVAMAACRLQRNWRKSAANIAEMEREGNRNLIRRMIESGAAPMGEFEGESGRRNSHDDGGGGK